MYIDTNIYITTYFWDICSWNTQLLMEIIIQNQNNLFYGLLFAPI